jgi:hypothetical protein
MWVCIVVVCFAPVALADLLSEFSDKYPAAARRLGDAYSHARILAKETRTDSTGALIWVENVEFLREGDRVRARQTVVESTDPKWPAGAIRIFGGRAADFFDASKLPTEAQFHLDSFGPSANFDMRTHLSCQPLFAAYCFRYTRLVDYLEMDGRHAVSAILTKLDGQEVVEVTTEVTISDKHTFRDHFFFLPRTWALAGWSVPFQPSASEGRITYQPNTDPPKILKVDTWFAGKTPDAKNYRWLSEVSSVEFGRIPATQFTPQGAGVTTGDPSQPGRRECRIGRCTSPARSPKTAAAASKPHAAQTAQNANLY